MDRRRFLRGIGLGAVAIVAAPQLVVRAATTSIAVPERRIFVPPALGWSRSAWGATTDSAIWTMTHIPGGDSVYVDVLKWGPGADGGYLVLQDMADEIYAALEDGRLGPTLLNHRRTGRLKYRA